MRCSAPWYELNISAPDNVVSACCYYAGDKDPWQDGVTDIRTYWNSKALREIRRIHGGSIVPSQNGCSNCFYFQNREAGAHYFDFGQTPADLSVAQRENLRRAKDDFEHGRETATCTPLRIYANFGFACNLACTMCHQVPRREANRRQVGSNTILAWREALESALDVTVIGGEPFALPEAIAFIRAFAAEPAFDSVRLTICTNGTVHHKHIDTLRQKRKLSMAISLNSIEEGFERIRVNGKWNVVEQNILRFMELKRTERPEWSLQTNSLIHKSSIPLLPRYAEWHARHGIVTSFYDFINSRGTEDAYYAENALHNPQLLDDMPDWENYFQEAIKIFRAARLDVAASTLDHYRARLAESVKRQQEADARRRPTRGINAWEPVLAIQGAIEIFTHFAYSPGVSGATPLVAQQGNDVVFTKMREGDHLASDFIALAVAAPDGIVRVRLRWRPSDTRRRAHIWVQSGNQQEIEVTRESIVRDARAVEITLTATLSPGKHRIRLVAMPVGEEESVLPESIELQVGGGATLRSALMTSPAQASLRIETHARSRRMPGFARRMARSIAPGWYAKLAAMRSHFLEK